MSYVSDSPQAVRAFIEAEDIARRAQQAPSTAHLLLALFTFPNRAQVLLGDRRLNEDSILREIRVMEDEPRRMLAQVRERAREIAGHAGSSEVDCLHVLIAVTRLRDAFAYRLLERTGTSITALRNVAMSYVTGSMPRRYRTMPRPSVSEEPRLKSQTRTLAPRVLERPDPDEVIDVPDESDELDAVAAALESEPALVRPTQVATKAKAAAPAAATKSLSEAAPNLFACGIDLTERAREGRIDIAIGRERELEAVVDILGKRRANNPVLVGPPGVGKTAIVEGLAVKIVRGDSDVAHFRDRILFALDTGALVAGTSLRGAFSERLGAIKAEVAAAGGRIVVFIDELHTLIGAGASGEGPQDAANELKAALARGEFPCIGATTADEYKKHIEKDSALERRFTPVSVEEPSPDEAVLILEGGIGPYSEHHGVDYGLDAVHAAVQLSHRFITERKLPDKAFAVIDLAGSRARRRGAARVERVDVARVVHEWAGVPLERLVDADAQRFASMEAILADKLIGHQQALAAVCRAVRRGFAGFNGKRPMGSFLFLGPTGVGKTELAKILAEFLFGRRDALVRFDMSELAEPHAVARLVGAQPGYVGFEEGGQLTEALRKRPFQVVLFDEIEKAHRDVLNVLLQVLDEGQLTDSRGRRVSFANTLVVLTSNLGADKFGAKSRSIGFGGDDSSTAAEDAVLEAARAQLAPELWGRLDERLVFAALSREQVRRVAGLQLGDSARALFAEREVTINWSPEVVDFLLAHGGYAPETGARGMRHTIARYVEGPLAEKVLLGELKSGDTVQLTLSSSYADELAIERAGARRRRRDA